MTTKDIKDQIKNTFKYYRKYFILPKTETDMIALLANLEQDMLATLDGEKFEF